MSDKHKMTKAEAGRLGGLKTVERYGRAHMSEIGKIGYKVTRTRYDLVSVPPNKWAFVHKQTGEVIKVWS